MILFIREVIYNNIDGPVSWELVVLPLVCF